MDIKQFLKPTIPKILIFVFVGIFYLYFAGEEACAAGFGFSFCYKATGFPLPYLITGDIDSASDYINTLVLSSYFTKSGRYIINYLSLILDTVLVYLLACLFGLFFSAIFKKQQ